MAVHCGNGFDAGFSPYQSTAFEALGCRSPELGRGHATARVHHAARRRGDNVAARGARAQGERMRRIGVLMDLAENDTEGQARMAAFLQRLAQLGWTDGRNVRIDTRWTAGDADRTRRRAAELIALAPDIVVATGTPSLGPLQQATRTVPIVFMMTVDPVGGGFVDSLARPGGDTTGSCSSITAWAANGWNYSRRSRRA